MLSLVGCSGFPVLTTHASALEPEEVHCRLNIAFHCGSGQLMTANETTAVFSPSPKDFLIVPLQRGGGGGGAWGATDTRAVKRVSVRDFVRSISCSGVAGALDPTLPSRWAAHCWGKLICTVHATARLHSTELWPLLMAVIEYPAAGRRCCHHRHPQYRATAIVNAVNTILC